MPVCKKDLCPESFTFLFSINKVVDHDHQNNQNNLLFNCLFFLGLPLLNFIEVKQAGF
jgi:hypothetical protein